MSGPPLERNIQSAVPNLGPGGAWTHNTNHLRKLRLSWASLGQSKSSMDFMGESYLDGTSCACSLDSGLLSTIWSIMQISATVSSVDSSGQTGRTLSLRYQRSATTFVCRGSNLDYLFAMAYQRSPVSESVWPPSFQAAAAHEALIESDRGVVSAE